MDSFVPRPGPSSIPPFSSHRYHPGDEQAPISFDDLPAESIWVDGKTTWSRPLDEHMLSYLMNKNATSCREHTAILGLMTKTPEWRKMCFIHNPEDGIISKSKALHRLGFIKKYQNEAPFVWARSYLSVIDQHGVFTARAARGEKADVGLLDGGMPVRMGLCDWRGEVLGVGVGRRATVNMSDEALEEDAVGDSGANKAVDKAMQGHTRAEGSGIGGIGGLGKSPNNNSSSPEDLGGSEDDSTEHKGKKQPSHIYPVYVEGEKRPAYPRYFRYAPTGRVYDRLRPADFVELTKLFFQNTSEGQEGNAGAEVDGARDSKRARVGS
ncbi:unnamed protein product [Vitrella brassicaformis CCMP3155]|uniref:Uncharacterized protein n=1 Tax=Vitrella brassicaformis (strain CCMP3155) TaxID=1169540 RepID=A0A0G4GK92_VITBC|nr:unnamed protein product [Vitrella brassicaformis CCMP3155]|eukprot:CEM30380.1 unnamed protein product [Vitrella brassicaformis CCMP3155]